MEKLISIIIFIIIGSALSRALKSAKQAREKAQKQEREPLTPHIEIPRETELSKPARIEIPKIALERGDEEFSSLGDESTVSDEEGMFTEKAARPDAEESFKEETAVQGQRPERESEKPAPKREPVKIAGTPITPQSISYGIIISEILRRPDF